MVGCVEEGDDVPDDGWAGICEAREIIQEQHVKRRCCGPFGDDVRNSGCIVSRSGAVIVRRAEPGTFEALQ